MNGNKSAQRLNVFIMFLALILLACQGAGSFNPFATATPTPTATFTPSVTPSPTPSSTPTYTPTVTPPPGKVKEAQPDGTTLFTDYEAGYQVTFPQNWTVVILGKDDINELLSDIPAQQQNVSKMIELIKSTDVNNLIRVVGFNFKAQQGAYTPNINITYDTNPVLSALSLKEIIDATSGYLSSLGIQVIHSEIKKTSSGIETGVVETQWSMKASSSQKVNLHQRQILLKSGKGVVIITFSTIKNATVDLGGDLEKLIESIRLLE